MRPEQWVEYLKPELAFRIEEQILNITLNRPTAKNALNKSTIEKLTLFFGWLSDLAKIRTAFGADSFGFPRLVVLRGEGDVFCSGADLGEMKASVNQTADENVQDADRLFQLFEAVSSCLIPICVCSHGAAMGGAIGLIASSDFSYSVTRTQFAFSEVRLGIAPAVISSFVFARSAHPRVKQLMLTGQKFTSEEAKDAGLIDQVFGSNEEMTQAVSALALSLVNCSPTALMATKGLCRNEAFERTQKARKSTVQLIAQLRAGASGQEGIQAFFERRKPHWGVSE